MLYAGAQLMHSYPGHLTFYILAMFQTSWTSLWRSADGCATMMMTIADCQKRFIMGQVMFLTLEYTSCR
jgi:hypothetical protein